LERRPPAAVVGGTVCEAPRSSSGNPAGDTFGRSWPIRSQGRDRQVKGACDSADGGPFIKRFPSGVFGVCLFNLVAFLWLEPLGLPLAVALAYGVDIAYVGLVGWLSRPRRRLVRGLTAL